MYIDSFHCGAHQTSATHFCLCDPNLHFLCTACVPEHLGHESYPIDQYPLYQALGKDRLELRRRNSVAKNCKAFLDRVIERETALQNTARTMISDFRQNYEVWLEENHRCFDALLKTLRKEISLFLSTPRYQVSSITQLLIDKQDDLDSSDELRFASVPEFDKLTHLLERCKEVCSRTTDVWLEDYKEEVLQAFMTLQPIPVCTNTIDVVPDQINQRETTVLEGLLMRWGTTINPSLISQDPDFSASTFSTFDPYSSQDEDSLFIKRSPVKDATGVYLGQWNCRNQWHGYGKYLWTKGNIYEGDWRNGERTGKGRNFWASNKELYVGDFLHNKREGYGTYFYASGGEYSGLWVNGKKQGVGSFKFGNGDRYLGEYQEDDRQGVGAYFWKDGGMYIGSWRADKMHGTGLRGWTDGTMYFGEYQDGEIAGTGCCAWVDGDVYRSQRKQGNKTVQARLSHPGSVEKVAYVDNVLRRKECALL